MSRSGLRRVIPPFFRRRDFSQDRTFLNEAVIDANVFIHEGFFDFIERIRNKLISSGRSQDTYAHGFQRMYVRTQIMDVNGIWALAIVVANVRAHRPGNGSFRRLVEQIQTKYPGLTICVECANPTFGKGLLRMGFEELVNEPRSYFLLPKGFVRES